MRQREFIDSNESRHHDVDCMTLTRHNVLHTRHLQRHSPRSIAALWTVKATRPCFVTRTPLYLFYEGRERKEDGERCKTRARVMTPAPRPKPPPWKIMPRTDITAGLCWHPPRRHVFVTTGWHKEPNIVAQNRRERKFCVSNEERPSLPPPPPACHCCRCSGHDLPPEHREENHNLFGTAQRTEPIHTAPHLTHNNNLSKSHSSPRAYGKTPYPRDRIRPHLHDELRVRFRQVLDRSPTVGASDDYGALVDGNHSRAKQG